jgi:hypothetical protein
LQIAQRQHLKQRTLGVGLRRFEPQILERGIDLSSTPLREGEMVMSDSSMAVQQTFVGQSIAEICSIEVAPQYNVRITYRSPL